MKSRSETTPQHAGSSGESVPVASAAPRARRPRRAAAGAGRKFQPATCPQCHTVTLHGVAAEGLTIHLDPTPLTTTTEAQAILAGRATWHMTPNLEACWRTSSKIRHWPAANTREHAVFADHVCDQPIPATISSWAWGPHAPAPISEEPPF